MFALAYAVACRWWEQALEWERERVWPARLHAVAGGDASADGRFWWWRAIGRDAVVFPEVMVLADALLDPDMAGLAWADSGAEHPRPLPADGAFGRELGQRVGRPWLGPLATADYGGPLSAWMGATIRRRRGVKRPGGYADDPWRVKQEHQPVTAAAQLRALAKNAAAAGSGTLWRSAVPAEQRMVITARVDDAAEQLAGLRGTQTGTAREAGRLLLTTLARSIGLLEEALLQTADAALEAGVPLADLADWTGIAPEALADGLKEYGRRVR